jgi:hypothetical protein
LLCTVADAIENKSSRVWVFRLTAALVLHLFELAAQLSSQAPQRIKSRAAIAELRQLLDRAIGPTFCGIDSAYAVKMRIPVEVGH